MAIQLVIADQTYDVERLTDTAADWQGVKVMLTQPEVAFKVASGAQVVIQGEEELAGSYRVVQALAPAAPRSWRLFLEKPANGGATPTPTTSATAAVPTEPKQPRTDVANADKIFVIKVSGLVGTSLNSEVRKSTVEYKVPFLASPRRWPGSPKLGSKSSVWKRPMCLEPSRISVSSPKHLTGAFGLMPPGSTGIGFIKPAGQPTGQSN